MNTGHDGSLTTIHANTPRDALARLETMIQMTGMRLSDRAMRQQVASAINLVVQVARLSDGSRRVTSISEITGMEGETITMQEIFMYERTGVDKEGRDRTLQADEIRPRFAERLKACGLQLPRLLRGDVNDHIVSRIRVCSLRCCGAYLRRPTHRQEARAAAKKALTLLHSSHTEDVDVVLARNELMSEIAWVNRTLISLQAALHLKRMLDQADLHMRVAPDDVFSHAGLLGGLAASVLTVFIPIMILVGLGLRIDPVPARLVETQEAVRRVSRTASGCAGLISRALSAGRFPGAAHGFDRDARSGCGRVSQSL